MGIVYLWSIVKRRIAKVPQGSYDCAAVALVATLVALAFGPGQAAANDSASYIDGARHLARLEGFVSCRTSWMNKGPDPIVNWPPGFSALMVPGIWAGWTVLESAQIVLGVSFVLAAVFVFAIARAVLGPRRRVLALAAAATFMLQPSQIDLMDWVLSDLPFLPTVLVSVYLALVISRARHPRLRTKILLGVAISVMLLVRNAGMLVVPGIFIGMLISMRGSRSLVQRVRELVPIVVTIIVLSLPWMIRNKLSGPTLFGSFGIVLTDPLYHGGLALGGAMTWLTDASEI